MAAAKPISNLDRIKAQANIQEGRPYQLTADIVIQPVTGKVLGQIRNTADLDLDGMLRILFGDEATDVILGQHPKVTALLLREIFETTGFGQLLGNDFAELSNFLAE